MKTLLCVAIHLALLTAPPCAGRAGESHLTGQSAAIKSLRRQIGKVAAAGAPVLIRGASGSDKELVAKAVHAQSVRRRPGAG